MENQIDTKTSRLLFLFSFALFVQATAALSVVGVLGSIASEWHISPAAGALLITAFGATFALSAPILQMWVGHWVRRTQILSGIAIMAVGAAAFALAPNYAVLFSARILMGLGAALLSPVLLALGTSLVKPKQQGAALAIISMGISLATVVGIPLSSWLVGRLGPRLLYGTMALLLISVGAAITLWVGDRSQGEHVSMQAALKLLRRPATLSGLLVIFFTTAGIFSTFAMITPILRDVYGAGNRTVSSALLLYGVSGLFGNFFVRRSASTRTSETLLKNSMLALIAVFTVLLILPAAPAIFAVALVAWPFLCDIIWPSQQRRAVELEPEFRGLVLALNSSFLFSGIALGSALGGAAYAAHGFAYVLLLSGLLVSVGLAALGYSVRAKKAAKETGKMESKLVPITVFSAPANPQLVCARRAH